MKIVLLYPPPWKIAPEGGLPYPEAEGPPDGYRPGDLDADFYQTPYGLFSLGAQAIRAGHDVKVVNLSSYRVAARRGDHRAARRAALGNVVLDGEPPRRAHGGRAHQAEAPEGARRRRRPARDAAPARGPEIFSAVDTACVGESDVTFLELVERVEKGHDTKGIAGSFWRDGERIVQGPERAAIKDLDDLASVQSYFDTHILMTSRGCPWNCTFCGAETSWGRGFRANSIDYVLDAMQSVLARLPVKMIQIKDDTFTTNKKRVLELCRGIRERKLNFLWSCDTRVDLLTDELLREMRLAGCQRLSLGVESGSQRILDAIDKKITVAEIRESTELAKKYGIKVRYYMMLGNRGDTAETFRETLDFLEKARPDEYIFSCLSIYPGTRDFDDAEKAWLDRNVYFTQTFQELKTPFDASEADTAVMNEWFAHNSGLRTMHVPTAAEYEAILERLGEHHAAHMDLGAAYYRDGRWDLAERHVRRALELGYPLPGLAYNHLACIAKARGDLDAMMELFSTAAKTDPQHYVLVQNVNAARAWFKAGGPGKGLPLELVVRHDFQLLERTAQPTLPGPLDEKFDVWDEKSFIKTPALEGSRKGLVNRGKLKVL